MRDQNGFEIRVIRREWRVQFQTVDQYERDMGPPTVLSAWPSHAEAMADLPSHADPHPHVQGRWVPKGATGGFVHASVCFGQTEITDPDEIRAAVEAALRQQEGPEGP